MHHVEVVPKQSAQFNAGKVSREAGVRNLKVADNVKGGRTAKIPAFQAGIEH
jgi:hypothetical protein